MSGQINHRIGVLGSGFIVCECHLPSYAKAGYQVVAIASRTKEKAAVRRGTIQHPHCP